MKKEIIIKRLYDDSCLDKIIAMHHQIFTDNELFGKLIYFDENFINYFRGIFQNENDFIFGVFKNEIIVGFLHLKKLKDNLFLNNIFLNKDVRGNGAGTLILEQILKEEFVKIYNFEYLELDVFESNIKAKNWYEKLGLVNTSYNDWFLTQNSNKSPDELQSRFTISLDNVGFKSLFFNKNKVATIVSNKYIMIHDNIALQYNTNMTMIIKESENFIFVNETKSLKLDTSIRMKGKIKNILDKKNYV